MQLLFFLAPFLRRSSCTTVVQQSIVVQQLYNSRQLYNQYQFNIWSPRRCSLALVKAWITPGQGESQWQSAGSQAGSKDIQHGLCRDTLKMGGHGPGEGGLPWRWPTATVIGQSCKATNGQCFLLVIGDQPSYLNLDIWNSSAQLEHGRWWWCFCIRWLLQFSRGGRWRWCCARCLMFLESYFDLTLPGQFYHSDVYHASWPYAKEQGQEERIILLLILSLCQPISIKHLVT